MESLTLSTFLATGFGLGALHAFDPDHMAAVSSLSVCRNTNHGNSAAKSMPWHFALRWSLGHGAALSIIAVFVCFLGLSIPVALSHWFEHLVAYMLILIGIFALLSLRLHLPSSLPGYGAIAVGLIHGTAGSAPLLALAPMAQTQQPWTTLLYVLVFCVGVTLSMIAIGRGLSCLFEQQSKKLKYLQSGTPYAFALFSIFVGVYLLI